MMKYFYILLLIVTSSVSVLGQTTPTTNSNNVFLDFVTKVYFNPTILIKTQNFKAQNNVQLQILPANSLQDSENLKKFENAMQKIVRFLIGSGSEGIVRFYFDPNKPQNPFEFRNSAELHCKFNTVQIDSINKRLNKPFQNASIDFNNSALFETAIQSGIEYTTICLNKNKGKCGPEPENLITEINTKPLYITVHNTRDSKYDLDTFRYDNYSSYYTQVYDLFKQQNVYVPAKLFIAGGSPEPISIAIHKREATILKQNFKIMYMATGQVMEIESSSTVDSLKIKLPSNLPANQIAEFGIYYKSALDSADYIVGSFMVHVYTEKTINLNLVSVNGGTINESTILAELNKIYGPVGVNFNITNLLLSGIADLPVNIDIKSSGLLSNYPEDLRGYVSAIKNLSDYKKDDYYMVFGLTTTEYEGYMPRGRNVGFVFNNGQNSSKAGKISSHELGHGIFHLRHLFAEEELGEVSKGSTENLMDYCINPHDLYVHQWEALDDPIFVGWFEGDDEDAALMCSFDLSEKVVYSPNGKLMKLPKNTKYIHEKGSYILSGYTYAFKILNEEYEVDISPELQGDYAQSYYGGYKSKSSNNIYPFNYLESSPTAYFVYSDNGTLTLYKINEAKALFGSDQKKRYLDFSFTKFIEEGAVKVNSCNINSAADTESDKKPLTPNQNILFNKYLKLKTKFHTFIYEDGQLITKFSNGDQKIKTFNQAQYNQFLLDFKKDKKSVENSIVFEKTQTGYKVHTNLSTEQKVKAGYEMDDNVKQFSEQAFETVINEYLKNANDLSQINSQAPSDKFNDGKRISIKDVSFWKMVQNAWEATGEFLEEAKIAEKYWNSDNESYSSNWINTPPTLTGIGNGTIEKIKEIPQLVYMAVDLATSSEARDKLRTSLSELTLEDIGTALEGYVEVYTNGGDGAWHQGGKDVVNVVTALPGLRLIKNANEALSNNIDDIAKETKKKAKSVNGAGRKLNLLAEEALGGHSIARHGPQLTLLEMEQRVLGKHPTIPQSRSALRFETSYIHEDAVNKAFSHYADEIDAFFANPNNTYKEWTFDYGSKVGSGYTNTGTLSKPISQTVTSNKITISIKRVANSSSGYRLESAFPEIR